MKITEAVTGAVDKWMETADPRVKPLPMMSSPFPVLCVEIAFLTFVYFGPKMMAHRKPFQLKSILLIYNPCMCVYNFLLVVFMLKKMFTEEHGNVLCAEVKRTTTKEGMENVYIGWFAFISKIAELSDTVFFILRKKDSQLSFLHIFHHSTVVLVLWLCANWLPGGQVWLAVLINSAIHVLMYGYYALAALGPHMKKYLWWKRYLTKLQMAQFILVVVHCIINEMIDCSFPKIYNELMIPYYLFQFCLFFHFYKKSYEIEHKKEE